MGKQGGEERLARLCCRSPGFDHITLSTFWKIHLYVYCGVSSRDEISHYWKIWLRNLLHVVSVGLDVFSVTLRYSVSLIIYWHIDPDLSNLKASQMLVEWNDSILLGLPRQLSIVHLYGSTKQKVTCLVNWTCLHNWITSEGRRLS